MLTYERASELLSYEPLTGNLRWKVTRGTVRSGALVTAKHRQGYIEVQVDGQKYLAHVVAWLLTKREWPTSMIDHRDGNPANLCWLNLRAATSAQNNQNAPMRRSNKSGLKGVSKVGASTKFQAEIQVNRRRIYLGCFETAQQAHEAYRSAALIHHGDFANFKGVSRAQD